MKTIFVFIPNYVYTTDLIRTGFLASLGKNARIIAYLPTLDYTDTLPACPNVEYRKWSVSSMRFWGYMKTVRLGLITEFDGLLSIQMHYISSFDDWRRRWLRYIARIIPFRFSARFFTLVERLFLPMKTAFKDAVNNDAPALVVTCTPGFTDYESEAIILAKKLKIPTASVNFSWDNLTTNCKHIRHTDYLIAWNEFMRQEAIRYHGYAPDHVFVSGPMRFDRYFDRQPSISKEAFIREKKLDPRKPLILLTTTSHGVYPYHGELIQMMLRIRSSQEVRPFNLLVRVHPKDELARYASFMGIDDVHIELAGQSRKLTGDSRHKIEMEEHDMDNLHATLKYADVAVNYGSTVTLEALACGTPVVNINFPKKPNRRHYEYAHYRPIIESSAVPIVNNEDELKNELISYLSDRTQRQKERQDLVDAFFYRRDGMSSERCAKLTSDILDRV